MTELYIRKDAAYKESIQTAKALLLERIRALETGAADDPGLVKELQELSQALAQVGGKHVYSYLPNRSRHRWMPLWSGWRSSRRWRLAATNGGS